VVIPPASVHVTDALVRELVGAHCPQWRDRAVSKLGEGFDNVLFSLGEDLVVRLPRHTTGAALLRNEQTWLPDLASRLALPVPEPLYLGEAGSLFPFPWSVVSRINGESGDHSCLASSRDNVERVGAFWRSLHVAAPPHAPRNPLRGIPLAHRASDFERRWREHTASPYDAALRRVWDDGLSARPFSGDPLWIHGDLHPANIIGRGGDIVGIIDFGDLTSGDPAGDLVSAWMIFDDAERRILWNVYPCDADTRRRAAAWAVLYCMFFLAIADEGRPNFGVIAQRTMSAIAEDSELF